MRKSAAGFALAAIPFLLAQSSYRVTHTYPLGRRREAGTMLCPIRRITAVHRAAKPVMVVDEDKGTLLGEVTGIQGAHGTAIASSAGHGFATVGQRQVGGDVRPEDIQDARPDPCSGRCRRHPLRSAIESRIHAQWRRPFFDRHRSEGRYRCHEYSARRQAGIWRFGRRRQGLREPHRH